MEQRQLGQSGLFVSLIGLGTMTWGEQNSEADAHAQMDYATDHGVNLFDAAEMYPVPPKPETQGRTESYIGSWFKARPSKRDSVILATKVVGRSDMTWVRDGAVKEARLTAVQIRQAIDASLKRLKTDWIDLYQLHWPDRQVNSFGKLGYEAQDDADAVPLEETMAALEDLRREGKLRQWGLSNDTPWGVMRMFAIADAHGWARPVSIQNPYSLLNRSYEIGLAEISHREAIGLLAYSPLAMGVLAGKYLNGARPAGARLTLFERFKRYSNPQADRAAARYVAIARDSGLDPAQMALAFVNSRPFLASNLIGATTLDQLRDNIASQKLRLGADVMAAIESVHRDHPNPSP